LKLPEGADHPPNRGKKRTDDRPNRGEDRDDHPGDQQSARGSGRWRCAVSEHHRRLLWHFNRRPFETVEAFRWRLDHQDDPDYRNVPGRTLDGRLCYSDGEPLPC